LGPSATGIDPPLDVGNVAMRAMLFIWAVIIVGGVAYCSVIGLTHH